MSMEQLGWNAQVESLFLDHMSRGFEPARVSEEHRGQYVVMHAGGECQAGVSGRFRHDASSRNDFPAVGDWVAIARPDATSPAVVHAVLPRSSQFVRKTAGDVTEEQVVAANVDAVLLVNGLDGDFNVRRIERYLTLAWDSGATPLLVLNKSDLCTDLEDKLQEVEAVCCGVEVFALSAVTGDGMDALRAHLQPGRTLALLGSSGVGKSSLVNALLGRELMQVGEVREDDSRGRHTTSHRQLILAPNGGILIDTPGMRELQLWGDESTVDRSFSDVAGFATQCRFSDCTHTSEPGCAVLDAVESGGLERDRLDSYFKLQRELAYLARKQDQRLAIKEKNRWKQIHMEQRRRYKGKS